MSEDLNRPQENETPEAELKPTTPSISPAEETAKEDAFVEKKKEVDETIFLPEEKSEPEESLPKAEKTALPPGAEEGKPGSVTLDGKEYRVMDEEQAIAHLNEGKALEGVFVRHLAFGTKPGKKTVYLEKTILKNSAVGTIDFSEAIFRQTVLLEEVVFQKEVKIGENAAIQEGILFNHCTFEKNLFLKEARFKNEFSVINSIFLNDCVVEESEFNGPANFSRATFEKKVSFKDCRFNDEMRIQYAQLKGETTLRHCHFFSISAGNLEVRCHTHFFSCTVETNAIFEQLKTIARLDLEKCQFKGWAKFSGSSFGHKVVVKQCSFEKGMACCNAQFKDHGAFPETRFALEAAFDGTVFESQSFFQEAYMESASFKGTTFKDTANFEKIRVKGEWLCQGTKFEKEVSFNFAETEGSGRISFNSIFEGPASFYRATFRGPCWFLGSQFQDVSFVNTTFEGPVFFSFDRYTLRERNRQKKGGKKELSLNFVSVFHGATNFTNTLFYRKAVFRNVFFKKFANFENACFAEEINFEETHFQEGATFRASFCSQELNFTKAVFDDYVNFDLANINRRLNLTDASIERGISFYHAVIDVVVVERDQIEGRLVYEGTVKGAEYKKHFMRVKEEYLILKESFQQRGKFDEEDWVYYRYRVNDRKSITQKAWKSLLGQPILAVQDDVPEEEREEDEKIIADAEKAHHRSQKALDQSLKKIEKLEEERAKATSEKGKESVSAKINEARKKIVEQEEEEAKKRKEMEDANSLVGMNRERQKKLYESKDKPFYKKEALKRLLLNGFWKCVDFGTGYGVKPFRIAFLALTVILLFAVIYHFSGIPYPHSDHSGNFQGIQRFLDWVYFSAMSFATSNPAEEIAYSGNIKFLIMTETLLGVFLMALFVGCYTRKIIR